MLSMNLYLTSKHTVIFVLICFIVTLGVGITTTVVSRPDDLYIRITDITWPPTDYSQGETWVAYYLLISCEIWNPHNYNLSIWTPNRNLLDPDMIANLEEDFPITAGYRSLPVIWLHNITAGITNGDSSLSISVENYNKTIPPTGKYTFWVGIDGNQPLKVKTFNLIIKHDSSSKIRYERVPWYWGTTSAFHRNLFSILLWLISGIELTVIVYFYWKKIRT